MVNAGTQHNVIPDRCTFVVDIRSNECYTTRNFSTRYGNTSPVKPKRVLSAWVLRMFLPNTAGKKAVAMGRTPFGSPTLSDQALMSFPSMKIGPGKAAAPILRMSLSSSKRLKRLLHFIGPAGRSNNIKLICSARVRDSASPFSRRSWK